MPIRFSTQAANADHIRPDGENSGAPEGMPPAVGADGTPRDRSDRREPKGGEAKSGQDKATAGKPGKDINAAGFVKDGDAQKP
jgi:hypothetical protein